MASVVRKLRYWHLCYLSKPAADRLLYRHLGRAKPCKILELGMPSLERSCRLVEWAGYGQPESRIVYTGIDRFESREPAAGDAQAGSSLTLKLAYRRLSALGARVRLVPGDAYEALSRSANALGPHDLLLVGPDHAEETLARAWLYVPRVLSREATVLRQAATGEWQTMSRFEIERLADRATRRRAA